MSADQLRRAADEAAWIREAPHGAVAHLLRTAAKLTSEPDGGVTLLSILNCLDDVAAAYLGEEPKP